MATDTLLALFHEPASTADAVTQLRYLGVSDRQITVMSGVPYERATFAHTRARSSVMDVFLLRDGVKPIVVVGAAFGTLLSLFLTVGIFLLYPLVQGEQPYVPAPPSLIIIFEVTMLGTMLGAFFGFLTVNRLPARRRLAYSPEITTGSIGLAAEVRPSQVPRAREIMLQNGAREVHLLEPGESQDTTDWWRLVASLGVVGAIVVLILLLFTYSVIQVPVPSEMANQPSIGYVEGPRLAAPAEAVPIQGPVLIAGEPATEPLPATAASILRGKMPYEVNCALCHGPFGTGAGPLAGWFDPAPPDLTSQVVQSLPDDAIYLMITEGRGLMPSLRENLGREERWDVVNYVRDLEGAVP